MSAPTHDRRATPPGGSHDPLATPLAVMLWVLVLAALAYGVWSTIGKVVNLFG